MIRTAITSKIPNIVVIGEREVNERIVTLRRYGVCEQVTLSHEQLKAKLLDTIRSRSLYYKL